jgi:hypothetical protein
MGFRIFCSYGKMKGTAELRSTEDDTSIQDGEVKIDIAVIAALLLICLEMLRSIGPSACGGLGLP